MLGKSTSITHGLHDIRKAKQTAKRKIISAIAVFAVLTLVSLAYAASSGSFQFQGIVARGKNIDVRFTNAQFTGLPRIGESVLISTGSDYKQLSISAQLFMPGDSRPVQFQIQNTGTGAVRLVNISTTQDDSANTGLVIQWPDDIPSSPNLSNYIIMPGATSDAFSTNITWDPHATAVPSGQFRRFSLILHYQDASLPLTEGS